jgi:uncharacterized protein (TIGR03437 family)
VPRHVYLFIEVGGVMSFLRACGPLFLFAILGAAQPSITNVVNNASGIVQALPNGGIAQGAIFLITGSGLGPSPIVIDPNPFHNTSVGGTSVSVTVGTTTVSALMYYSSDGQLSAVLPSSAPTGTGTVTVTYNGNTSSTAPITVVQNNPGIFTASQNGQGVADVTYPDGSVVSPYKATGCGGPNTFCGAANPGDIVTLWATGLGPVNGNDATGAGLSSPINVSVTIWLGGVQITPSYNGRSGYIGLDQINFTVPSGVPTGCAVPIALQVGSLVSNYALMAVANGSRSCTPSNPALTPSVVQSILSSTGSVSYGQIALRRQIASASNGLQYVDVGQGSFAQIALSPQIQPLLLSYIDTEPMGACLVSNTLTPTNSLPTLSTNGLDAGRITVTGPAGIQVMREQLGFGQATVYSATFSQSGTYFSGGNYTVSGAGGTNGGLGNVSSFAAQFTITQTPSWTSDEQASLYKSGVSRANGATINWNGSSTNYYVEIDGSAATDSTYTAGATFSCLVNSNAGTFTIPPSVLLAFPASSNSGVAGEIDFRPTINPVPITASGLNLGSVTMNYLTSLFPAFI